MSVSFTRTSSVSDGLPAPDHQTALQRPFSPSAVSGRHDAVPGGRAARRDALRLHLLEDLRALELLDCGLCFYPILYTDRLISNHTGVYSRSGGSAGLPRQKSFHPLFSGCLSGRLDQLRLH